MAKTKRTKFVVEGSGQFPFDMLRYDHCWPYREGTDSYQLGLTHDSDEYFKRRQVTLITDSPFAPKAERWASFNWRVVSQEQVV